MALKILFPDPNILIENMSANFQIKYFLHTDFILPIMNHSFQSVNKGKGGKTNFLKTVNTFLTLNLL